MKLIQFIAIGFAVLNYVHGYTQDAAEIVKKADYISYHQGKSFKAQVSMVIIDKKGRERHREMTMLRKNDSRKNGQQKYFVYFKKPADVNKMVFMVWKNKDRSDDRWLYLPAMDLVKRIAASDERTSFAGSHFVYEDVSGRGIDKDDHKIIANEDEYFVIKSTPRPNEDVDFAYKISRIHKESYMPMKVTYFTKMGAAFRTYTVLKMDDISGFPTVLSSQMEDNLTGSKTRLDFHSSAYDLELPDNLFSERFLRRPPLKLFL